MFSEQRSSVRTRCRGSFSFALPLSFSLGLQALLFCRCFRLWSAQWLNPRNSDSYPSQQPLPLRNASFQLLQPRDEPLLQPPRQRPRLLVSSPPPRPRVAWLALRLRGTQNTSASRLGAG